MFTYITEELPKFVESLFPISGKKSILGHSMGGHGALICALKKRNYESVSAFAPIANPTNSNWGQHAFKEYAILDGKNWDGCELLKLDEKRIPIKID